ncbi:glutathione S-transferase family protein [Hansschlegelia zhihuaiae]|uniref:Glutathione S-transferase family protein n=1 Tax=Hansschlegelia zhihuaiae TaxID=405005 RepID=A0A4Q0MH02_9HYPH|nr:glutathione S-transferase family protein [Hansschlegelia zhihuaiae]RXF72694.1 glutathione S-transferase family protein [Hansschlegelia zhihuaiae]
MTLKFYGHVFSSYTQKAFIAFYEKNVPFELRHLSPDNPDVAQEWLGLWPIARFPVLVADGETVVEATSIIEWLDIERPQAPRLIPEDRRLALDVRTRDRIFDNYVMTPMQTIVFDRLRPEGDKDPFGVAKAHELLDRSYAWLDGEMASREWAAGDDFTLADCAAAPSLFYADWVHPLDGRPNLIAYYERLRRRPSFARCVEDARPARELFPGGAPKDRFEG